MASRAAAAMVLAGALPVSPGRPLVAAGARCCDGGIRGRVSCSSHRRSDHPSCEAEEGGVVELLKGTVAALAVIAQISVSLPADAILYSPDTNVPRTGELALRRAIPANPNMKTIQESLEDISYLLRIPQRKPYGSMEGDVKKAMKIAMDNKDAILASIPVELKEKGSKLYTSLLEEKGGLQTLLKYIKENDPDRLSVALASSLDTIAELELLQAPGLSFLLPQQYLEYPRLAGRAVVEFSVEKGDGSTFFPTAGGEPKSVATIQVVIDGYSAPLTAGNFAKLVLDGAYDGIKLKCASQAIIADNENGKKGYTVPLEVMPAGQFEPLYRTPLSIQDGELPVLPMSVYGAVAMAHSVDSDEYSSPTQFFFYLYDKRNSGLGGISFDEGQFSVFGYTTDGREVLSQIKTGDIIRSAKLVQGRERLEAALPRRASLVEPRENVSADALDVLVRLPEEHGVHHPVVYLDGLVLAGGGVVQRAADGRVGHLVGAAVHDEERDGDLAEAGAELVGGAQQLDDASVAGCSPQKFTSGAAAAAAAASPSSCRSPSGMVGNRLGRRVACGVRMGNRWWWWPESWGVVA
uniref:PPIase cyclophilin-type domain-containing protein n=1 Tax=Oryza meridionalis TaxID=40149 RepID=A0A0E0ED69_9ORYZ